MQPEKQKNLELDNDRVAKSAIEHLGDPTVTFFPHVRAFGRFEIIRQNPLTIVDVAHNRPALLCFLKKLSCFGKKPIVAVVAFSTQKRAKDMLDILVKKTEKIYLTEPLHERIISIDGIANHSKIFAEKRVKIALEIATEQAKMLDGVVVILGSFFIMPEALTLFGIEKVPGHWGLMNEKKNFSNPWGE